MLNMSNYEKCSGCVNFMTVTNINNDEKKFICTKGLSGFVIDCASFDGGSYSEELKEEFPQYIGGTSRTQKRKKSHFDYYEGTWR